MRTASTQADTMLATLERQLASQEQAAAAQIQQLAVPAIAQAGQVIRQTSAALAQLVQRGEASVAAIEARIPPSPARAAVSFGWQLVMPGPSVIGRGMTELVSDQVPPMWRIGRVVLWCNEYVRSEREGMSPRGARLWTNVEAHVREVGAEKIFRILAQTVR